MNIRRKRTREITEGLLEENQITQPFVPIDIIAEKLGIRVKYIKFDDDSMSGCIIRKKSTALICINSNDSENRQRFTIAHEIGHFMLHKNKDGFVDKGLLVHNRDSDSSKAIKPEEIEANYFAAELLMPKKFIENDLEAEEIKDYDKFIYSQADRYKVSAHAMTLRLANLGYLVTV